MTATIICVHMISRFDRCCQAIWIRRQHRRVVHKRPIRTSAPIRRAQPMQPFRGHLYVMVTPFTRSGEIDVAALRNFVSWQIAEGIDGLIRSAPPASFLSLSDANTNSSRTPSSPRRPAACPCSSAPAPRTLARSFVSAVARSNSARRGHDHPAVLLHADRRRAVPSLQVRVGRHRHSDHGLQQPGDRQRRSASAVGRAS